MKLVVWMLVMGVGLSVIHIPPQGSTQSVTIRLGESRDVNFPNFPFKQVYSRGISKFPDENNRFNIGDVCNEMPARLKVEQQAFLAINPKRPRKAVIYELEDIMSQQSVVDATLTDERVLIAFQNGSILSLQTKLTKKEDGQYFTNTNLFQLINETIEIGQFLSIRNAASVYFITDRKLYQVNRTTGVFTNLQGYKANRNFESAVLLHDRYIAVALGTIGIAFYQLIGYRDGARYMQTVDLTGVTGTNATFYANDLAVDENGTLFVLDEGFGMIIANTNILNGKLKFQLVPHVLKKRNCDNIAYNGGDIYLTCRGVYRYGVHTDRFEEQLPDPMFKVKELYAYANFLIIMGENDFRVYQNDKLVDEILEQSMDKFLILDNHYLAINEYSVSFGNYSIKSPVINCFTRDPRYEGTINVIMTTQAECNQEYMQNKNVDLPATYNDTCLYTTPVQLIFWSPRDLSYLPFIIMSIMMGTLLIVLIIWMFLVKRRQWQLRHALSGFHLAGSKTQYDVMVEEAPNPNDIIGNKDKTVEMKEMKKDEPGKPASNPEYDIGD